MTRLWRHLFCAAAVIVLSLLSVIVVISNAGDEPYVVFRHSDAMIQIGGAFVLLLLWLEYAVLILAGVIRHIISIWWLSVLIWGMIVCVYLCQCPFGYVGDITKFVIERR